VRHIEALNSQTGPVFLTYRSVASLDRMFAAIASKSPTVDFTAADGVRHTSWIVSQRDQLQEIEATFASVPSLYIADGHHRSAAAGRVFQTRNGAGGSGSFLVVIFPHDQMRILAYNRALKDLNGRSAADLLKALGGIFEIKPGTAEPPARKHELGLRLDGRWHHLTFKPELTGSSNPVERLDVDLLQRHVLDPLFGIKDPRTSDRISFVGGIRGTVELERLVASGEHACAFSMHPTDIGDLMAIADAGGIMPPKSTWFEPKLRDAMFCHLI
jgi:uncharacterized protein (DUF1015 family)